MFPSIVLSLVFGGALPAHHTSHLEHYGSEASTMNRAVLQAVDIVQATAPDGGGYFIGVSADPPESPVGYPVGLFGKPLLAPPRCTSYCSGASYAAFVTALDLLLAPFSDRMTEGVHEAIRMQEKDGGRREDMVKLYGWWNADGPGSLYALTGFSSLGVRIAPREALPGDFCNINWVKGPGHSVVFLGWENFEDGSRGMRFWSSQVSTNGLGDKVVPLASISGFVFTRLTTPSAVFQIDGERRMARPKVVYDVPEQSAGNAGLSTKIRTRSGS